MKEGVSKSLETLSEIGGKVRRKRSRPLRPDHPRRRRQKLVDSVSTSREVAPIIDEMRVQATRNSAKSAMRSKTARSASRSLPLMANALILETKAN